MGDKELMVNDSEDLREDLLNTIRVPQNLHYLTDKLPKANYEPIQTRVSCINEFGSRK